MAKNLVIVESPAKAKTIESFLGNNFIVKSCYGHVRDLSKSDLSIEIDNKYNPIYQVSPDKKQIISELKKLSKEAETVWLASDEDREGEAISWHLVETLNLNEKQTKRIVFHEITKPAILKAIENPRAIDLNLVNAQQARRVLDRLVGYELSPVLWKKVKPSLSAGRVQSVAVRLLVEREREIQHFKTESSFRVSANFEIISSGKRYTMKAQLPQRFATEKEAEEFLESCKGAEFSIASIEKKPAKRSPSAPFTTSTLQQEASRKLGYSVAQTMVVAQRLYESGLITYMRTDSVNLSDTALNQAKEQITKTYGEKYLKIRKYATKSKGAQEAHEAIRPTYLENTEAGADNQEKRLYDLIWKRTIASQMSEAELEKTSVKIAISSNSNVFEAEGQVVVFDGFLKIYSESTDEVADDEIAEGMLPPVQVGEKLKLQEMNAIQRFSNHPPRYTEASLVKKLEELGIGRPSTYAPTISTIQKRNYVLKEDREGNERKYAHLTLKENNIRKEVKTEISGAEKSKLFPTDIGIVVNDFLIEHFGKIMDFNFTAKVEKEFDEIAEGMKDWTAMIDEFYGPFHKNVERTLEESERATGMRLLGTDPASGKNVYARIGRYGPLVQIGENDDEDKKFANLRKGFTIETIELSDALELFKLPKSLGNFEDKEMVVGVGRFGPYVRHNNKFYSIPKGHDPLDFSTNEAIALIEAKRKAESEKVIKTFDENPELQILNGRFGPYISLGKENFKIPKDKEPSRLSFNECMEIVNTPKSEKSIRFKRKKS
ncbi:MAG: type I DNA topoisomerase [Flavobacteriales bacterium]